ncbi:MAG: hypothetical protein Q8O43_02475 [Dehalococcoidia bacterium]|nr:hypothetical protein [Dehalococcoidia bacterium]
MTKKMTVVFHDEELYTDLKIEAVKRNRPASEIIAEALHEWLDEREDEDLVPIIKASLAEGKEKGNYTWEEVAKEVRGTIAKRRKALLVADKRNV